MPPYIPTYRRSRLHKAWKNFMTFKDIEPSTTRVQRIPITPLPKPSYQCDTNCTIKSKGMMLRRGVGLLPT